MSVVIGSGSHKYELIEDWEKLPEGYEHPDVVSACTDSNGRVYMLTRSDHPVMVFERDGTFVKSWGEGRFTMRVHGMFMTPEDELYIVDDRGTNVGQYTLDGELVRWIGPHDGVPSDTGYDGENFLGKTVTHGGPPYNRPTNVIQDNGGDLFVSDGYGNSRVHHFDKHGELLKSWGEPGTGPGEFQLVHDLAMHPDGRLFVADSTNDRIQIFNRDGEFLEEWLDVQRPRGLYIDADGLVYVGELVWRAGSVTDRRGKVENEEPSRLSVYDPDGKLILRHSNPDATAPGAFVAPHGIWTDRFGDIYIAEVTQTIGVRPGFVPPGTHTFQKFARL
jgi:hypothetical protein